MKARTYVLALAALAVLFGVGGFLIGTRRAGAPAGSHEGHEQDPGQKTQKYVCSMNISFHPYFESYDPDDKCGFCGMDLIPAPSEEEALGERAMTMSPAAMKLAEVTTVPVERRFVDVEIPLVGKVDYDETRVRTISAWVAGRLDRLFVDYTGIPVKKGDHLVEIYSPELYAAQEELLQSIKTASEVKDSDSEYIRKGSEDTVVAVREKLRLLGLKEEQIGNIEKRGKPTSRVELTAPIGGIVIHKNAKEGMYVKTGSPIYTVADLSRLWVKLDAYESDLAWVKYGQDVAIRTESYGDRVFKGWISFVDPILNPETRTVKVRVLVDNPEGLLRPNMFVRATVKATVGKDGPVPSASLEGKWICPMHPEVVADEAEQCTVCGMDLVKAETLGYVAAPAGEAPLVLPSSAVLITGKRALVYVRLKGKDKPTFEGREVELGPRAGDSYILRSGLAEGDDVVVNGNFKIDSALQLMAKPSMMSPEGGAAPPAHHHGHAGTAATPPLPPAQTQPAPAAFKAGLHALVQAYYGVQTALANDDPEATTVAAGKLRETLAAVPVSGLGADAMQTWNDQKAVIEKRSADMKKAKDIQAQRMALPSLSAATERLLRVFGPFPELTVRKAFCPMAFDNKGASWLQEGETIANPYFGDAMLRCGVIKEVLSAPAKGGVHHEGH